jgi:tetratricopeptide (TPR) repeat protein
MIRSFLFLLFLTGVAHAQEPAEPKAEAEVGKLLPSQQVFLNLPEEKRQEFAELFDKASRYFQQKRIFETLDTIYQAEKIFPESSALLNLRGSCYVEIRAFDKAMKAFEEALEIDPDNISIRFNIAEVNFVTKQWQKAHDKLVALLEEVPEGRTAFARLIEFKILLCKSKLGMDEEVQILAEKYGYQDDSPYHYYAKAALAYANDDLLEAEQWLARANRIFRDPNVIAPWQDTLVEFGYIKSFYGSAEETDL